MGIIVQKYGGSSLAEPELILNVAKRIIKTKKAGHEVVVVVSAMGDTTDDLLKIVHKINKSPSARELDVLLSTGEQITISLLAMAIESLGYKAISLTGYQAGIETDNVHNKAKILEVNTERIKQELEKDFIVVVAGFQGFYAKNTITTLGRGGSDTTAVAIAAELQADFCEIYTDVDGVYTADPRLVADAKLLPFVFYDEMLELASLGTLILQPRAVEFAKNYGVKLKVKSSFSQGEGTLVGEDQLLERQTVVSGVTYDENVAKIALFNVPDRPGIAKTIFKALAGGNINVDMIVQSWMHNGVNDIAFTVTKDELPETLEVVECLIDEIGASGMAYNDQVAKISIVGAGMITNTGVAATMFEALADEGINIDMISTSEIKISCVINILEAKKAVIALHNKFNLGTED